MVSPPLRGASRATVLATIVQASTVWYLAWLHKRAPAGFAPIAMGLGLTLIHLIGIPVTNLSVNPARSTGPAIFQGGWALGQLWLFWLAPIVGAVLAGITYKAVFETPEKA